jgi:zinc transport system substrate-binding protein
VSRSSPVLVPPAGALLLAIVLTACVRPPSEGPRVAASIFPIYDLTRRVAGERLRVDLVLPPGHTTHFYDPRPQDVAKLAEARIVFAVGLGLDGWVGEMAKNAGGGRARVSDVGPLVDPILVPEEALRAAQGEAAAGAGEGGLEPHGPIDPHFWLDPVRMQRATDVIVEALQMLHPEEAPFYRTRGDEVNRSLLELHHATARRAASWRRRKLVTFHGSLFYYADRYGLEVAGVVEPVPGREPSARAMARVLEAVRKEGVPALFSEPQLDPRAARAIAAEAGLPLYEIDPVGGGPGVDSYEKLLGQVTQVLEKALK